MYRPAFLPLIGKCWLSTVTSATPVQWPTDFPELLDLQPGEAELAVWEGRTCSRDFQVWCGVVWCGVVWFGAVWYGVVCCGMVVWHDIVAPPTGSPV